MTSSNVRYKDHLITELQDRVALLEAFVLDVMPIVDIMAEKTESIFYKTLRQRATFLGVVDYAKPDDAEAHVQGELDV